MTKEESGLRCHDAEACALGLKPCPTPQACNCAAPAPRDAAAQPSRECLQQSAETMAAWPQDIDVSEAYREAFSLNPDNAASNLAALAEALRCRHRAALQAAPPAPAAMVRVADLVSVGNRFYSGNWLSEEGVRQLIDAALAAAPAQAVAVPSKVCDTCDGKGVEGDADDYGRTIDVDCGGCDGTGKVPAQEHATQLAGQAPASRAYAPIDPVSIVWHASPEAVDAAHWTPICEAEGITLEELRQGVSVGVDERGVETEFSQAAVLQSMRDMGFWGFVDTKTRTIHAWADTATPDSAIMEFLGHEIGHVTGTPDERDWEEEQRADQYGGLVKMAHALLLTRPQAQDVQQDAVLPKWWPDFIQNVTELPDRNSPEDEPDAMIATAEELGACAIAARAAQGGAA